MASKELRQPLKYKFGHVGYQNIFGPIITPKFELLQ